MRHGLLAIVLGLTPQAVHGQDPRTDLHQARADERGVLDQLNQIDRELDAVRTELTRIQTQVAEHESSRRRAEDDAAVAQAQLDLLREQVREQLGALYRLQRRGLARIIFSADEPSELRRRARYLGTIIDQDSQRLAEFRQAMEAKSKAVATADRSLEALGALRAEVQLKEAELRDQRARRVELLTQVRSRQDLAIRAMSEMAGARSNLSTRITSTQSEPGPTSFRSAYGQLPWPVRGPVTRRFGSSSGGRTGTESYGIDITADFGTPIRAVFPGVVTLVDFIPGYGQTVAVQHGSYTTVHAHANGVRVRQGQRVDAGTVLALVGNSGLTDGDGYLLTFEIRYNGTPQDPLPWLKPL